MSKLTKKEKAFCLGFLDSGSISDAERYAKIKNGDRLLCREEICEEIERLAKIQRRSLVQAAKAGLRRLATGSIADAVSLIYMDNPDKASLENLDLFMVSEIRRKENSMEIKFFDRFKALNGLINGEEEETASAPFYDALIEGARKLGSEPDED